MKKRTYGLTRVVDPDPRSRGERGVLERHGEPCSVDEVEEADHGLTRVVDPDSRSRGETWRALFGEEADLRPYEGR